jgi:hypothetical protein
MRTSKKGMIFNPATGGQQLVASQKRKTRFGVTYDDDGEDEVKEEEVKEEEQKRENIYDRWHVDGKYFIDSNNNRLLNMLKPTLPNFLSDLGPKPKPPKLPKSAVRPRR